MVVGVNVNVAVKSGYIFIVLFESIALLFQSCYERCKPSDSPQLRDSDAMMTTVTSTVTLMLVTLLLLSCIN